MPILLIILSILVIIILVVLFTDIGITISYNHKDGLLVSLKWLFIKTDVLSKVKENAGEKQKEKPPIEADAVMVSKDILSIIAGFKHKFTITELKINLNLGTGDAAETAIACGGLYSSIYGILGALQNAIYIVPPQININPIYSRKTANGNFTISFSTKLILLRKIAFKFITLFKNQKRTV